LEPDIFAVFERVSVFYMDVIGDSNTR